MTEIHVGSAAEFQPGSRQLIKCGTRNIAVFNIKGRGFYAIDNACYHHGGPLHHGDIEDLGGHPCVVCPWHQYRIALDTGEGLYWGVNVSGAPGGAPQKELKSKGCKQRTHKVENRNGEIYCIVDVAGTSHVDSDTYAEMPIANKEVATQHPVGFSGVGSNLHSGMRSGDVFTGNVASDDADKNALNRPSFAPEEGQEGGLGRRNSGGALGRRDSMGGGGLARRASKGSFKRDAELLPANAGSHPLKDPISVRIIKSTSACPSGISRTFTIDKVSGHLDRRLEPGMHATFELPEGVVPGGGGASRRSWTITGLCTGSEEGWIKITVKRHEDGRGASKWLHDKGEGQLMTLVDVGGNFTIQQERPIINDRKGRLVMISGGIGITPIYASLHRMLTDPFTTTSGPSLHIVHIHVEHALPDVCFLEELRSFQSQFKNGRLEEDPVSFQSHLFLTQQDEKSLAPMEIPCHAGRPSTDDIANIIARRFGEDDPFVAMVCGPAAFMQTMANGLMMDFDVPSNAILREEFD